MLEDIRDHSPTPRPQEIEWMAARPLHAVARVLTLAAIALCSSLVIVEWHPAPGPATVARAEAATP